MDRQRETCWVCDTPMERAEIGQRCPNEVCEIGTEVNPAWGDDVRRLLNELA